MVRLLRLLSLVALVLGLSAAAAGGKPPRAKTPARLSFELSSYDFGTQIISNSTYRTLTLTNTGDEDADSLASSLTGAGFQFRGGAYPGNGGTCSYRLRNGHECKIVVRFNSDTAGDFSGSLTITYFDSSVQASTTTLLTAGAVGAGLLVASPSSVNFGNVVLGSTGSILVTLKNVGGVRVTGIRFASFNEGFSAIGTTCSRSLSVNAECAIELQFTPTVLANYSMSWRIRYDDGDQRQNLTLALSGSGINSPTPDPVPDPNPTPTPDPTPTVPASPDASFGNSSWTTIDGLAGLVFPRGIAMQADGKILVVATDFNIGFQNMMVTRLLSNGQLDASFGYDGRAWFSIYGMDDEANAIAVQSDGRIVVAGYGHNGNDLDLCVIRVTTDGLLDTSFNASQGWNCVNQGNNESANSVRIQSDGKIVVGGYAVTASSEDYLVVRLNADGTLDSSFNGGAHTADFSLGSDFGNALGIQSNGSILLAGTATVSGRRGFGATRWTSSGSFDSGFGQGGFVYAQPSSLEVTANALATRSDDSSVMGGYVEEGASTRFALVGMSSDGQPDAMFGSNAMVTTSFADGPSYLTGLASLPGNLLIAAGYMTAGDGISRVAMAAYNRDGSLNTTQWSSGTLVWTMEDAVQRQLVGVAYDGVNSRLISVVTWMDDSSIKIGVSAYVYPTAP